jgi:hypothetical protein
MKRELGLFGGYISMKAVDQQALLQQEFYKFQKAEIRKAE